MEEKNRAAIQTAPNDTTKVQNNLEINKESSNNYGLNITPDALEEHSDEHLSLHGMQPALRAFAESCAHIYQCPIDWIMLCQYATVGVAVGNNVKIDSGNYINSTALWYGIVAKSGDGKSEPMNLILSPISEIDSELTQRYNDAIDEWEDSAKSDRGSKPKDVHYLERIFTPEAMMGTLNDNPHGILVARDEMSSMFDELDAYNKSGFDKVMLSLWDGRDTTVRRVSRKPMLITNPYFSILGGIQPGILQDALGKKSFQHSGFLGRFLWCYIDYNMKRQRISEPVSTELMTYWHDFIHALLKLPSTTLSLSNEADELYTKFFDDMENKRIKAVGYMTSVYSKLEIIVLRWAGITQLMREGNEHLDSKVIEGCSMEQSIRSMSLFEYWAKKVYKIICGEVEPRKYSKEEIVRLLNDVAPIKNQSKLAEALEGIDRSTISKALSKS